MTNYKKNISDYNIGDEVEVCFCDTSAICVWSHPAVITYDESLGKVFVIGVNEYSDRIYTRKDIDGCYTYLSEKFKR